MPELPYADTRLEPVISRETVEYHYFKHLQGYVNALSMLVQGTEFEGKSVEDIIKKAPDGPIFNNAGQIFNHVFYFMQLSRPHEDGRPRGKLADLINDMLHDNARQMVYDLLGTETQRLLHTPVCNLCRGKEELFSQLKAVALKAYTSLVSNNLPRMLATLNIQRIIEDRINQMDMAETEALIVSILNKELRALVWFGVLLGFLLGFITNLI